MSGAHSKFEFSPLMATAERLPANFHRIELDGKISVRKSGRIDLIAFSRRTILCDQNHDYDFDDGGLFFCRFSHSPFLSIACSYCSNNLQSGGGRKRSVNSFVNPGI